MAARRELPSHIKDMTAICRRGCVTITSERCANQRHTPGHLSLDGGSGVDKVARISEGVVLAGNWNMTPTPTHVPVLPMFDLNVILCVNQMFTEESLV